MGTMNEYILYYIYYLNPSFFYGRNVFVVSDGGGDVLSLLLLCMSNAS
jgi:hypothetical protein